MQYEYFINDLGVPCVMEVLSGEMIVYHSKSRKNSHLERTNPYFFDWFRMSNSQRQKVKEMSIFKNKPKSELTDNVPIYNPQPIMDPIVMQTDYYSLGQNLKPIEYIKAQDGLLFRNVPCEQTPVATGPNSFDYWTDRLMNKEVAEMYPTKTTNTVASAVITAAPSESQTQRDYLMSRFTTDYARSYSDKLSALRSELAKKFNINAPRYPRSSAEIIAAFKDGRVKIDQKKVDAQKAYFAARDGDAGDYDYDEMWVPGIDDRYYGITFLDLPVADQAGYDAAMAELSAKIQDTKDTIMVFPPEQGLAALKALEAWEPTGKAN